MVTKCHQCGKRTVVMYPQLWAYKRGEKYFCTWTCLRTFEKNDKGANEVKLSEKSSAAIRVAMAGGDPLAYLKEQGSKYPSAAWYSIKAQLKEKDPDLLQKVLDAQKAPKPVETVKTVSVESEEPKKIDKPVVYAGMTVREVEGSFGRYRRSDVNGTIYMDFEYAEAMDTISLTIEQWGRFRNEMLKAAEILGVMM